MTEAIEVRLPFYMQRTDDEIAAPKTKRLGWDLPVPPAEVKVEVTKRWIILTGQIDWHYQKEVAAQNIHRLFGAIGIHGPNHATIEPRSNASNISDG